MKRNFLCLLAALTIALSAGIASASVQFNLSEKFSADGPGGPTGTVPLVDVRIYDIGDLNNPNPGDNLILGPSGYNLTSDEALIVVSGHLAVNTSLSTLVFNIDPTRLSAMSISYLGGSGIGAVAQNKINIDDNGFGVDGSGKYDVQIEFVLGPTFTGTDYAVFKATYTGPGDISALDFDFKNTADGSTPPGPYYAAARINAESPSLGGYVGALESDPTDPSDPIPFVPEPGSMVIWGLGLGIAGLVRLRRKK